jgi:hypothetical protein
MKEGATLRGHLLTKGQTWLQMIHPQKRSSRGNPQRCGYKGEGCPPSLSVSFGVKHRVLFKGGSFPNDSEQ